jgi:hypothetical protein
VEGQGDRGCEGRAFPKPSLPQLPRGICNESSPNQAAALQACGPGGAGVFLGQGWITFCFAQRPLWCSWAWQFECAKGGHAYSAGLGQGAKGCGQDQDRTAAIGAWRMRCRGRDPSRRCRKMDAKRGVCRIGDGGEAGGKRKGAGGKRQRRRSFEDGPGWHRRPQENPSPEAQRQLPAPLENRQAQPRRGRAKSQLERR